MATPVATPRPRLQVGLGFPDLRVRANVYGSLDAELKAAFGDGEAVYGGRVYWRPYSLGPVDLVAGVEGGGLSFNGVDTLNGGGDYGSVFAGLQYNFLKRWMVMADIGPAWIHVESHGYGLTEEQWVLDTALYYALF